MPGEMEVGLPCAPSDPGFVDGVSKVAEGPGCEIVGIVGMEFDRLAISANRWHAGRSKNVCGVGHDLTENGERVATLLVARKLEKRPQLFANNLGSDGCRGRGL